MPKLLRFWCAFTHKAESVPLDLYGSEGADFQSAKIIFKAKNNKKFLVKTTIASF